jgi:hypothetical protein
MKFPKLPPKVREQAKKLTKKSWEDIKDTLSRVT